MPDGEATDITRKLPIQERARRTIETILEATAQILADEGSERLTTNHLARKAGFSIGTIYQYFPNREAIVLALIERQRAELARRIETMLDSQRDDTAEEKIRSVVQILHEAFNVHRMPEQRLIRGLMQMAVAHGLPTPPNTAAQAIVRVWMESEDGKRQLNESEAFVFTRSITEVLRQAALQASPLLGTKEFEDALLRLITGFLYRAPAF